MSLNHLTKKQTKQCVLRDNSDELTREHDDWLSVLTMIPIFMLISYVAIGASVWFVGQSVVAHPEDLAAITSFIAYLMQIFFAILIGGMMSTFASRGFVSLGRIKAIFDTKPDLTFNPNAPAVDLTGDVAFENVSFTYRVIQPLTTDISFKIKAGEMVGIVGATGSGKTTLAQLIPRLYDPTKGEVLVGGVNLKDVNEKSLRSAVSFVLQRAILFSGKISDNLRQGKPDATSAEFQRAAEIAQAAANS